MSTVSSEIKTEPEASVEEKPKTKVFFKSVKKRRQKNFRGGTIRRGSNSNSDEDSNVNDDGAKKPRRTSGEQDEEEEEEFNLEKMQETKELQKLRQR